MKAVWSGALHFGLIYIPVKLYSASKERALAFKLFARDDLSPIAYARISQRTGMEVPYEDIVRGYEYASGEFVTLEPEDFKRAFADKAKIIRIFSFAEKNDIHPKYFEKPYYIEPSDEAGPAYLLLRDALAQTGTAGIARLVLKDREYIAAIQPDKDILVLLRLRYEDEIRAPKSIALPGAEGYSKEELDIMKKLIARSARTFDPASYQDSYVQEMQKVIRQKIKGAAPKQKEEKEILYTQMKDLMGLLKKSLEKAKR